MPHHPLSLNTPCAAVRFLVAFADLHGRPSHEPGTLRTMRPDRRGVVQRSAGYVPPVRPGDQRMTMHLDFEGADLPAAVTHARELGAREAGHQPQAGVRVLLDPPGHPFCLYVDETP